ncbi:MAG: energy transducer TonB [Spirochaetes bacterium]|nr:energy transducer TonB [Spirochaetota bacterium]
MTIVYLTFKNWSRRRVMGLLMERLEEGRLVGPIAAALCAVCCATLLIPGLFRVTLERTPIDLIPGSEVYHIRRVSELPKELEKNEAEKKISEDALTPRDILERYIAHVVARIESNKVYPEEARRRGHEGDVVVGIVIGRDGTIGRVAIEQSSRYPALTHAAVASIRRSMPLPPFPPQIPGDSLRIRVIIRFSLR